MRAYTFSNCYLSSIQNGIQPAHCLIDMFVKYNTVAHTPERDAFVNWATNHKTMICLNGGNATGIQDIYNTLQEFAPTLGLPFAKFNEDEQSLNGALTCCGIIVPEAMYEFAAEIRAKNAAFSMDVLDKDTCDPRMYAEFRLITLLNAYGLAK